MANDQHYPDNDFDEDGSGWLAIIGIVMVLLTIGAGILLNLSL